MDTAATAFRACRSRLESSLSQHTSRGSYGSCVCTARALNGINTRTCTRRQQGDTRGAAVGHTWRPPLLLLLHAARRSPPALLLAALAGRRPRGALAFCVGLVWRRKKKGAGRERSRQGVRAGALHHMQGQRSVSALLFTPFTLQSHSPMGMPVRSSDSSTFPAPWLPLPVASCTKRAREGRGGRQQREEGREGRHEASNLGQSHKQPKIAAP